MKVIETGNAPTSDNETNSLRMSISELRKYGKYSDKTDEELQLIANGYLQATLFLLEVTNKKHNNESINRKNQTDI